jgi:antitoxin ParD1/3/4
VRQHCEWLRVALSPHFETLILNQGESGRYNKVSEVVRAGLRLVEDTERQQAIQPQALRNDIASGKASGAARRSLRTRFGKTLAFLFSRDG